MRKAVYAFGALFLGTLMLTTGCTTKKRYERDMTALQGQISSLQSEVARLDQSLKDTETALKTVQDRGTTAGTGTAFGSLAESGPVYRTPSGFELPTLAIQKALKNAGYYQGDMDGKVGTRTKEAIRNFQRDQGITPDGVCGRQTWSRLKSFA